MTPASVLVIGGGISGLTVAWWLRELGHRALILERDEGVGGTMKSVHHDGWLWEIGPNSSLETTPLIGTMCERIGLLSERIYAHSASAKRYVLRNGDLHCIPMSPRGFLTTGLWSAGGKLRLLKEPFVGRGTAEESVAAFVERRLGREFLDYAINPFVAGVYAGDPAALSVSEAFPKLYALEAKYGGLIKGMVRGRTERRQRAEKAKDRAKMFSFRNGMQSFPDALASALDGQVLTNCLVSSVSQQSQNGNSFVVRATFEGREQVFSSPCVVVSTPAYVASDLLRPVDSLLAESLQGVQYPPVAEVFLGFPTGSFRQPLDGFGFLVPEKEKREILGTIWSSSLFEGRAPLGYDAFTTFVGGSRQPSLAMLDDQKLVELVVHELHAIMRGTTPPSFVRISRWEKAIPQYTLGYRSVLDRIGAAEREHPGLFLCSNFRGGIAVGDCIMSGEKTARIVSEYLGSIRSGAQQQISEVAL